MARRPQPAHHPEAIERHERRARVFQLRLAGKNLREIGRIVGVSHEQVRKDLAVALEERGPSEAERNRMRALENARLDQQLVVVNHLLTRAMAHVASQGNDATFEHWEHDPNSQTRVNVGGTLQKEMVELVLASLDRAQRISEARRRINALDAMPEVPLGELGEGSSELVEWQGVFRSPQAIAQVIQIRRSARLALGEAHSG